jgi:hypothetical protein
VTSRADGARGYPGRLSDDELHPKFLACAQRSLARQAAVQVLEMLRGIEAVPNITALMKLLSL